jgi:beta-galactosidase
MEQLPMKSVSRRNMLKTNLLAPAVAAAAHGITPIEAATRIAGESAGLPPPAGPLQSDAAPSSVQTGAGRERLLLDFGWRFHLGDACNAAMDCGLDIGRIGNSQKTGDFLRPAALAFEDSVWEPIDVLHDWAVELPFQNDPAILSKGLYPSAGTNIDFIVVDLFRLVVHFVLFKCIVFGTE